MADGFTKKYDVGRLVWYELHGDMVEAITREKQLKKWNRAWKIRLIEETQPELERLVARDFGVICTQATPWIPTFAGMTG